MTTIEERAREHFANGWTGSLIDAYIQGATEQKEIDDAKINGILDFAFKNREFMKPYGWFVEVSQLVEHVKSMYPDKDIAVLENGFSILRQTED